MATPNAPSRPGRMLLVLTSIVIAMYGIIAVNGEWKPKLALDLEGGTSVQLKAIPTAGKEGELNRENMQKAKEIIEQRVNGAGVSESEVAIQGTDSLLINVPKALSDASVDKIGQTALLSFRPVLAIGADLPPTKPAPAAKGDKTAKGDKAAKTDTKKQGRAIPASLRAAPPAPGATAPNPAAPPIGSQPGVTGTIPPDLQGQWDALNCAVGEKKPAKQSVSDRPVVLCDQTTSQKYALGAEMVAGKNLTGAAPQPPNPQEPSWYVSLSFDSEGAKKFSTATTQLYSQQQPNNQFAIVLDEQVFSAPSVNAPIPGGSAQITGSFQQKEATDLANVLKFGALPLEFEIQNKDVVSPTLGGDYLNAGLIAMVIGLGLTALYSLFYYRGLGVVSLVSLGASAAITYGVVVLLGPAMGFALSLAGIAGLVIAIGITADSFIVYFERVQDEVIDGRSLRAAVEHGWIRARRTILVADFVSFLAAAVLYLLTTGGVRGFAFTLGLTTVIDVVVVFMFTKPLIALLARTKFFANGHPLSGLDAKRLGITKRTQQPSSVSIARRRSAAKEA